MKTKACKKLSKTNSKTRKSNKKPAQSMRPSERCGVFFAMVNNKRRSVYEQNDHTLILADLCRCHLVYAKNHSFEIVHTNTCPIDEHRAFHGRRAS